MTDDTVASAVNNEKSALAFRCSTSENELGLYSTTTDEEQLLNWEDWTID